MDFALGWQQKQVERFLTLEEPEDVSHCRPDFNR